MNSQSDNPSFDEHDLLIRQALDDVPVPQGAKNRARQRLTLAELETSPESYSDDHHSSIESNSAGQLSSELVLSAPFRSRVSLTSQWVMKHRRQVGSLLVAASVFLAIGVYFLTRPIDRLQLVAVCSQFLDGRLDPQPAWDEVKHDVLPELVGSMGLRKMPQSVSQVSLAEVPVGSGGKLWKLEFNGRDELYVLELRGAALIQGVGRRIEILQSSSNRWSVAAHQQDEHLVVFMTKGNLEQFLRLVPLA